MEINTSINILAVITASIVSFIFGWLWYGPFFGKVWARENGMSMEKKPEGMGAKMFYHFLLVVITVLVTHILFTGTLMEGFLLALLIWAGYLLTNTLGSLIWMKGSTTLAMIDIIYHILNLLLIVWVLTFF